MKKQLCKTILLLCLSCFCSQAFAQQTNDTSRAARKERLQKVRKNLDKSLDQLFKELDKSTAEASQTLKETEKKVDKSISQLQKEMKELFNNLEQKRRSRQPKDTTRPH